MNFVKSSVSLLALAACFVLPAQEKSLLERDPQLTRDPRGWQDILPAKAASGEFAGWTRLAIPRDPLSPVSQWKVENGVLVCEGDKGHEWLRYDTPVADFVLHAEFRYTPIAGNPRYNSGIFVRTTADYSLWYQLQVGASQGGYFFGLIPLDGRIQRFSLADRVAEQRVKPAGEWNVVEVTAKGSRLEAWVNGAVVTEYNWCPVEKGHIGLEAEGFRIEFRNLKLKLLN